VLNTQIVFATDIIDTALVNVSATVGATTSTPTTDNGGGSGSLTSLTFSGYAYPQAVVHVWKDGTPKTTTTADNSGYFTITLGEVYSPNALYTLYAFDKLNRRSLLLNYPIVIKTGYMTQVSGIRFAPTISIDKTEVKFGDYITVSGYAQPNQKIDLSIYGLQDKDFSLTSNTDGVYQITIPLLDLQKGNYNLHVNYKDDKRISKVVSFTVGDLNIPSIDLITNIPGDCNADQVINLVDFSVMAFWYGKSNSPACIDTNNDNIINLVDFSILAFYWTG
jgi:hypothetical protein